MPARRRSAPAAKPPSPSSDLLTQKLRRELLDAARATSQPLAVGDLLVAHQEELGGGKPSGRTPGWLPEIARELGLPVEAVRQRYWVAVNVPKTSPIRQHSLPFSILRVLAGLVQADAEEWAERAATGGGVGKPWTVRELKAAISAAAGSGTAKRRQATEPLRKRRCRGCKGAVPPAEAVVVQIGMDRRATFCGKPCAIEYLGGVPGASV